MSSASDYDDTILGDLAEGWNARSLRSGGDARWWYWRRTLSITASFLPVHAHRMWRRGGPLGDGNMTTLIDDARRAVRALARQPAFTFVTLLVLALGIGANAAIFGVVRGVLLAPLAFPDPDRAVAVWSTNAARGWSRGGVSRQDADDWARENHSLLAIGTYTSMESNVVVAGAPERIKVAMATNGVFRALAMRPELGRWIDSADDATFAHVAVISHAFWARALRGDRTALGRTIDLDGQPFTVIGVMPPAFDFPDPATAVIRPFSDSPEHTGPRQARWVQGIARLRPGVSLAQARVDMQTISARLAREYPSSNRDVGVLVEPLLTSTTQGVRQLLWVAWGMTMVVLLIVTITTTNLFLARAAEREGEMAVRAALGASRVALARRYLAESVVLAIGGGALGTSLALVATPLVRRLAALELPRAEQLSPDAWVAAYAIGMSLLIGLAFGLRPALAAARTIPGGALATAGRMTVSRAGERLRGGLVAAQIAFAAVVLISAGLLLRSFERLSSVQPGFALAHRISFRVAPSQAVMRTRGEAARFYEQLTSDLAGVPGIRAVTAVNRLPLTGSWWTTDYRPEDQWFESGREPTASYRVVLPGYFAAMDVPLLRGRALDASDEHGNADVTVVSKSFADRAWPGADAVGRRVTFDPNAPTVTWYTVVGVVGDVHTDGLANAAEPLAYVPFTRARFGHFGDWGMDVVVDTRLSDRETMAAARAVLHALAPSLSLYDAKPLVSLVDDALAMRRVLVTLIGALALVAAILSALGIYGVVAYSVTQRRAEFGLRMALGANSGVVLRMVMRRGASVGAVGAAVGTGIAAVSSRAIAGLLYGIGALDGMTFVLVSVALLFIALVATLLPAVRAMRIDPVEAMRG
jgi:putative ABC transport system permease protein